MRRQVLYIMVAVIVTSAVAYVANGEMGATFAPPSTAPNFVLPTIDPTLGVVPVPVSVTEHTRIASDEVQPGANIEQPDRQTVSSATRPAMDGVAITDD